MDYVKFSQNFFGETRKEKIRNFFNIFSFAMLIFLGVIFTTDFIMWSFDLDVFTMQLGFALATAVLIAFLVK